MSVDRKKRDEIASVLGSPLGRNDQVEDEGGHHGRGEIRREINPDVAPARKAEDGNTDRNRGIERSAGNVVDGKSTSDDRHSNRQAVEGIAGVLVGRAGFTLDGQVNGNHVYSALAAVDSAGRRDWLSTPASVNQTHQTSKLFLRISASHRNSSRISGTRSYQAVRSS
jgi:hypothetical protein